MASHTQFYLTRLDFPLVWKPSGFQGTWDLTSVADNTGVLIPYKAGSNCIGYPRAETSASVGFKVCLFRFLLGPLNAQTITGTVDPTVGVLESAADADFYWAAHLYVSQGESDLVRGTLLNNYTENTTNEWPTTATGAAFQSAQTLTNVTCSQGDYIVAELGYIARNATATSKTGTMYIGATGATYVAGLLADLTVGSTAVGNHAGFLTFGTAIDLYEPAPADNDLVASNIDLFLYDGTTGELKKRVFMPTFFEPAGGGQDAAGNLYLAEEHNQLVIKVDTTLTRSADFDVSPGVTPHAVSFMAGGDYLVGYAGDGTGMTSCNNFPASFAMNVSNVNETGTLSMISPGTTGTYTVLPAMAFARPIVIDTTVTTTFANGSGAQPTVKIGELGNLTKFAAAAAFTNATFGTFQQFTGTLSANKALLVTITGGTGTATGGLDISATSGATSVYTLMASEAFDRTLLIGTNVVAAFTDGTGAQTTVAIGQTGNATKFAATSAFTNAPLNQQQSFTGTLTAGTDLIVTVTRPTGTGTGGLTIVGEANAVSTAPSYAVQRRTTAGASVASFTVAPDQAGSNAIDLASDQTTLAYTSLGRQIKRYDIGLDSQMADWVTLPPATAGEMARGIRILPDGGFAVADVVDIKRYNSAGTLMGTFSVPGNLDWGTLGVTSDGLYLWAANTANPAQTGYAPMIAKFSLSTYAAVLTITGPTVPDTDGSLCSGGITVWNGFRAATTAVVPPSAPSIISPPFAPGVGGFVPDPIRRQRTGPVISAEEKRIIISRLQFVMQPGIGATNGQGSDPEVMLEISRDNGHTFGTIKRGSAGAIGNFLKQTQFFKNGQARNWVLRLTVTDPVVPWVLIDALGELEPGPD